MTEFRHAICNEVFGDMPFRAGCEQAVLAGYTGLEIAPFTIAENPSQISPERRREMRDLLFSMGLTFVGLHWLMVSPPGLHVTAPDAQLRSRSWRHIVDLIDLCADLGPDGIMVFGSPKQRETRGIPRAEAMRHFIEGLAGVAPHAEDRGVTILVEALPANQCDIINTLGEAVAVVNAIGSPAVRTMFDTHNAVDETEAPAVVLDRYFDAIRHIHINELDGRHPGTGGYDFKPLLEVLRRRQYRGWISLEVFDFSAGAEKIANDSLRYIEKEINEIAV